MIKTALLGLACALVPSIGFADGFAIHILSTQYHTEVSVDVHARVGDEQFATTRSQDSATPLQDAIQLSGDTWASADAATFALHVLTDAAWIDSPYRGQSTAFAESAVTFEPLADGLGTITLDFFSDDDRRFTQGFVQLQDLTSGDLLWYYYWERSTLAGTVPWSPYDASAISTATLQLDSAFDATHQYAMTLSTRTDASTDSQNMTIHASGLDPVPEPASLLLIGLGSLVAAGIRKRRDRRPGSPHN